tara:strand:+ start:188 stop:328 length:141 start_codon:yes stop_codon:yes gene_type:complete
MISEVISLADLLQKVHVFPEEMVKKELRLMVDLGIAKMDEKGQFWI